VDALALESRALREEPGREAAARVDDAVAGHGPIAAVVHREADEARGARVAGERRDHAVRSDPAARDAAHHRVDTRIVSRHEAIVSREDTMSDAERNKNVVRKIEEAWAKNDVAALDQYFAPDFASHSTLPGMPATLASAKGAHAKAMQAFPDRKSEILDVLADGDRVAVRLRVRGTNTGGAPWFGAPPNGKSIDFESWAIYRLRDGRVVEAWGINDGLLGMIQLGSLQPPRG
jgi:predicted ester cyclase